MWSLYENRKFLKPLVFSNGKTQEDIVREVLESISKGYRVIFIKGKCGSGKSALALNLAKKFSKTSLVVPIKSLQEQYIEDYSGDSGKKYILKNKKKLKIFPIVGRNNFKCTFLKENKEKLNFLETVIKKEKNAKLTDIFEDKAPPLTLPVKPEKDESCDNNYLPCKIEIKEENISAIKDYIKQNSDVNPANFSSIKEVKRMTIAPICPYWSPIMQDEIEIRKFKNSNQIKYLGLNNKRFTIYQRRPGCPYYDQYNAYSDSEVIIFNSLKYKIETLMDRKPLTEVEIIDECDEFLDSFANQEQISINRLLFSLSTIFAENEATQKIIDNLIDITNAIKTKYKQVFDTSEILEIKNTLVQELLMTALENSDLLYEIEADESNYLYHLDEIARIFIDLFDETFFSVEKRDNDLIIHLVTINIEKKFKELLEKNKILIMMSGTIHSESVLKNIFGLENFKIIEAETKHQGQLIKCRYGYEMNCRYSNFKNKRITRERYLNALSKTIFCAKPPVLVHVNSFSDLPTESEKEKMNLTNLPTQRQLIKEQRQDPFNRRIEDFKNKKIDILFTTKCSRGIDFPGETCNSIVITRFPYPNISSIFWKIIKKTRPAHFRSFYLDKANRELLQKIYRGLRSKEDKVYLLSPDSRVLDFKVE